MKRTIVIVLSLAVFSLSLVCCWAESEKAAAEEAKKKAEPEATFIGASACKMCHNTKKMGKQYKIWSEGPHAKAFVALGSEEALKLAKKAGVKGSPQESPKCLKCHSTASTLTKDQISGKLKLENGVECESCHGPGSAHKKMMMKKKGKTESTFASITQKTCVGCHNEESPTYKKFEFAKAKAIIDHPIPGKAEPEKSGSEAKPKEESGKVKPATEEGEKKEEASGSCTR